MKKKLKFAPLNDAELLGIALILVIVVYVVPVMFFMCILLKFVSNEIIFAILSLIIMFGWYMVLRLIWDNELI